MTYLEKTIVRRGHPKHMIVAIVGFIWVIYFFWTHDWIRAAVVALLTVILGWLLTFRIREELLAETLIGRMMLVHLHPMNVALQSVGFVILMYGVWVHAAVYVLIGASLVFLGHLWGWNKVSEAL